MEYQCKISVEDESKFILLVDAELLTLKGYLHGFVREETIYFLKVLRNTFNSTFSGDVDKIEIGSKITFKECLSNVC